MTEMVMEKITENNSIDVTQSSPFAGAYFCTPTNTPGKTNLQMSKNLSLEGIAGMPTASTMLSGVLFSLRNTVHVLVSQIIERARLKDKVLSEIEKKILRESSWFLQLEAHNPFTDPMVENAKEKAKSNELSLERERTDHQMNYWKDMSSLRGELLQAFHKFESFIQKSSLLGTYFSNSGDLIEKAKKILKGEPVPSSVYIILSPERIENKITRIP